MTFARAHQRFTQFSTSPIGQIVYAAVFAVLAYLCTNDPATTGLLLVGAVQGVQQFNSLGEIPDFLGAGGLGIVGGQLYYRPSGMAPIPVGQFLANTGGTLRQVAPALSSSVNGIYGTIQAAVDACVAGDAIVVAVGAYDETVTIPRTDANGDALNNLAIYGLGGRGAAFIEPSTEDADGLIVHADDVMVVNLGAAAEDTTAGNVALEVTGARFRSYGCKYEGGATQCLVGPGTAAQIAAGTHGDGADALFVDPEVCWGTNGFIFRSSDYGACTQAKVRGGIIHNILTVSVGELDTGVIGAVRDLILDSILFANSEDATPPTDYVDLDSAGSTGLINNCTFARATNEADVIQIAAGIIYTANKTEAGITAARPS